MTTYGGTNRHGVPFAGTIETQNLPAWIQARYDCGWQALTVKRGGVPVGGIRRDLPGSGRVWWAA